MGEPLRSGAIDQDVLDRSRRIGWLDLDAVSKARVLMVGAGAIGNEVAKDLVLSGFKRVTIVDMDHVVGSNLSRCLFFSKQDAREKRKKAEVVAKGLTNLAEDVEAVAITSRVEDLPASAFHVHDIVLGCLDNVAARIHVGSHAYAENKVLIDGAMDGFVGKVMVARPPEGACLQCGMNRTHSKIASLRFSCTGREVVFHEPLIPAEITTTSVIAAVIVREALKVVSGKHERLLSNCFYYDGLRNVSEEMEVPRDPACAVHSRPH